jgi:hypothetical protein
MITNRVNYLRSRMWEVLKERTRNSIVTEIKDKTQASFHQFNLDRFLYGEDVKISTLQKIDDFITNIDDTPANTGV